MMTVLISAGQTSPQFLVQPSNTTAYLTTTLACTASGDPTPFISWLKDGSPLDTASNSRWSAVSAGLEVRDLQGSTGEALEGVYHCVATNSLGSVRSLPATLSRTGQPNIHSPLIIMREVGAISWQHCMIE